MTEGADMVDEREEVNAEEEEKNTANIDKINMQNLLMDKSEEHVPTAPKRTFDTANVKEDTSNFSHSRNASFTNENAIK